MEERIRVLEENVKALRTQSAALSCIVQTLLHHFDENEHTARWLSAAASGYIAGQLNDPTLSDESLEMFTPILLSLLPEKLQGAVSSQLE